MKRKFDEADVHIVDQDRIIDTMAIQMVSARADTTVTKYCYQIRAFDDFCEKKGISSRPACSIHVAMYLSQMIDAGKSDKVISSSLYAIKWLHRMNDYPDPTINSTVLMLVDSAKRLNSKPIVKKDVISTQNLIELCSMYLESRDIIVLRDLSMIVLGFAGFLRFNEIVDLRCCDLRFSTDHLVLYVKKSKTDVYRSGREVFIAKGETSACPIAMLKRYLQCSGMPVDSELYLFRAACRSGSKCFLLKRNKKLSYSRSRVCIVSRLKLVAPDLHLGTHSLRASGATAAANASGVSDRCLKRHGRWKTDIAKDGYIEDSVEKKLFVTKQLKL